MRKILGFLVILILITQGSFATVTDTNRVYGLTLDGVGGLSKIMLSLSGLCKKPTTRIVFDEWVAAAYYQNPVNQIHNVSFIMGEILDSYYMSQYDLQQYTERTQNYLDTLGDNVDIWEIGNEINGEWCDSTGNAGNVMAKINAAYQIIKSNNKKTAITLYYNKNCWSNPQNEMFRWVNNNISQTLRNGLDYVWVSYYEDDCNGYQPNWQRVFDSLRTYFPNSKLGMGECGTNVPEKKAPYINKYYKLNVTTPNFVGGYFWWYYKQDCVPQTDTLWTVFNNAISNSPTIQATQINCTPIISSSISLCWIKGNGSKRLVFLKAAESGTPLVLDATTYNANTTFGLGTSDGNGWYCVYNGCGSGLTVNGLSATSSYRAMVIEYNDVSGYEEYNNRTVVNNPRMLQGATIQPIVITTDVVIREVKLKWSTTNEVDNFGFSVERKTAGNNNNWMPVEFVKGNGNNDVIIKYEFVDKNLPEGKYNYRLKQTDIKGNFVYHNLSGDVTIGSPVNFELSQNYPNPFNPVTNISFGIPLESKVIIKVYDFTGREVKILLDENKTAGYHTVVFDASNISSGVYFYKIQADKYSQVKKMMVVK